MLSLPLVLEATELFGRLERDPREAPLSGGEWFTAEAVGAGFECRFQPGVLAGAAWLTADFLADGNQSLRFVLELAEGEGGPTFELSFRLLNQCQARMRFPLAATDQGRWGLRREGGWLKPICRRDRVDPAKVDRLRLILSLKGDRPARWCMTPMTATADEPPLLTEPLLPRGPLLDELGQSTIHDWPGKTRTRHGVTVRLRRQLAAAPQQQWPTSFSRWGGWRDRKVKATGFFRTHHDGRRWWLVDGDGHLFFSAGLDCVRVDTDAYCLGLTRALAWPEPARGGSANYLRENFVRAFGAADFHDRWAAVTVGQLRAFGFNTIGNWSELDVARGSGIPYVRPMSRPAWANTPMVFRDFPDVFEAGFAKDADAFADQLDDTRDDPALIGYFLMNEPTWGFAGITPAEGMLRNTPRCAARRELANWLLARYGDEQALRGAWGPDVSADRLAESRFAPALTDQAQEDLAAFSTIMAGRLFTTLSESCRKVDPNHLNLGARYHTVPPAWALAGMRCFDVFSINCYKETVRKDLAGVCEEMSCPAIIGEWHFGSLDVGLPATGLVAVPDQTARGRAYRGYFEDAAAQPWCVGVHWFTLYDQSALGRSDGEAYNIGFLDVCNRPYGPLARAARTSHERLYEIASGARRAYRRRRPR